MQKKIQVSWSREVSSKNGRDSQSRETDGGEKIAATSEHISTPCSLFDPKLHNSNHAKKC